jgi:uncharacterized OB-fold protein
MSATVAGGILQPFLDAAAEKRLVLPHCAECGHVQWYPQLRCDRCSTGTFRWREHRPTGTVFTSTVVWNKLAPDAPDGPIAVVLVELDDAPGCRLVTNREDGLAERMPIGTRVLIRFVPDIAGNLLLKAELEEKP